MKILLIVVLSLIALNVVSYGYFWVIDLCDAIKAFRIRRQRTWWMKNG